jgi:RNA polymerase sigma factor FliA
MSSPSHEEHNLTGAVLPAEIAAMVEENMRLVGRIAFKLNLTSHYEPEDLVQDGYVGLLEAASRYDPQRGASFRTFVSSRVVGAMRDASRDFHPLSRSQQVRIGAWATAEEDLIQELGRVPSNRELATKLGWDEEEVQIVQGYFYQQYPLSLDESIRESDGAVSYEDVIADPNLGAPEEEVDRMVLRRAIERIEAERDKEMIILHFYEGLTLKEIGEIYGVTESRVSQIMSRNLKKLASRPELQQYAA